MFFRKSDEMQNIKYGSKDNRVDHMFVLLYGTAYGCSTFPKAFSARASLFVWYGIDPAFVCL